MASMSAASSPSDDAPVTIATFPNPHEAEMARAALEAQGLVAIINNDHGQYPTAGSWVHLQVARHDGSSATSLLEQGPSHASEAADEADDMRPLRQRRRFILARWFLYASAVWLLLFGVLLPLSVVAFGLALWSRRNPGAAFGVACGLQTVVVFVSIATSGALGLGSLIPLFAFYFAWASASPEPAEWLVASPLPGTFSVDIGNSWKAVEARGEPMERPTWVLRFLCLFLLGLVIVWMLSEAVRFG
jgi:hypothetical protein